MWRGSAAWATSSASRTEDWKPWTFWDGTPLLVPGKFNTEPDENGDILMYVDGDQDPPPCALDAQGGFYFDSIIRQEPIDDDSAGPATDNAEDYGPISDGDLAHLAARVANGCTPKPTRR